ncbi:MAG: hypothetical protein JW995_09085 [Melioribacteraceae bacterium]|nr:hypothetical protein [Melioribacteraceae bacterium]
MKKVLVLVSMLMLMILISCELKQESTDDGTVTPTEETIIISTPASGTELVAAESYEIQWNSDVTQNVNIQYTTNNGSSWINIISNIENTGSYIWDPVPNTPSAQCRIKIFTLDSTVTALSTGFFSILEPAQKSLKVDAPDGGEVLIVDEEFDIKWTSVSIRDVKIQFSTDNGSTWNSIVESFPADSGIYNWNPIPNSTSIQCLVKISDIKSDTLSDVSDATFAISVPKNISVVAPNGGESWTGNTNQTIRWYSSEVENVKIEYTLDNGVSWNIIVASTPSDGFYTWDPIPNSPSSNAKIRVTNIADGGFPSDESDGVFNIEPEVFITVMEPNGDEEWLSGSGHYIKWNTSKPDAGSQSLSVPVNPGSDKASRLIKLNDERTIKSKSNIAAGYSVNSSSSQGTGKIKSVSDVKIEYSTNNGGSWYTIVESTPNIGYYLWNPLPVHNSVLCVVRVSDAADGVPFDLSDNSFTISQYPSLQLVVETPNGGEEWNSGTTQTIKWTSTGITSVAIDYSTNNGVSWITIEENIPSSGYYTWNQVPNTASNNCKVRIRNVDNSGVPFDESNGTFAILPEPGITVKTPNGGEILQTGTSNNVTWTSENIQDVKVELTTNNGASWSVIEATTPSDGNYTWTTIPDINSSLCKIRVSDASDGIPSDISDQVFTITNQIEQTVEVQIPNGGELWEASTSKLIQWASNGIDSVRIEYSSNNGISWTTIAERVENTGSFDWTVPNVNSTQAKIRVRDSKDNEPSDESNGTFTIRQAGSLKILKPESGDVWISGDANRIEWEAQNVEKIKIEYTLSDAIYDPEASFFDDEWITLTEDAPGAAGFYEARFTTPSNLYRIRISDSQLDSPVDFSGLFTVKARPVKSIAVQSPNGAEQLFAGSSYSIKWTSSSIQFVNIDYTTNNGATWDNIVNNTESDGIYNWNAVPSLSSSLCKVRIVDAENDQFFDESDANFEIVYQNETITLTSPNGGEAWQAGTTQEITWQHTGIQNVKIELTTNNGISWSTVVASTPSDGYYTWTQIPLTASTNCKIKISDADDSMPSDDSDEFFTISPEPGITVISPNGGESFLTGTATTIRWTSVNIDNVKIEYTTNGGASWAIISSETPSDGAFSWENIPDLNSLLCQVRISDADDYAPLDISDSYFEITNQVEQTINVLAPNGGELYEAGTTRNITWSGSGVSKVSVEFTNNNGLSWQSIATNIDNTGAIEWSIPITLNSPQCKIRVKDADDDVPTDESDGTFTVKPAQSITIISPVGGEIYDAGEAITIQWNATGIENVGIRYTTTNGLGSFDEPSFYTLTSSTPNTGELLTSFSVPSNLYYIEIYDAYDDAPRARSIGNFTILPQQTPSITVISPNGGEALLQDETHNILWNSKAVENVAIEVSTNGGATWTSITTSTPSDGNYNWDVSTVLNLTSKSDNCLLRISDANSVSIFDESDGYFTVQPAVKYVNLISPNGGEEWDYDEGHMLVWESAGITFVNIYFSYDNGVTWQKVANNVPNTGGYEWDPPNVDVSLGRIKIEDATDATISDISDGTFKLDNLETVFRPFVYIVQPIGSSVLTAGTVFDITWNNSEDIVSVDIEYSADNGQTWANVVLGYTQTAWDQLNTFSWNVPATTTTGRIRITGYDVNGGQVIQTITDPFTIQ